MFMWHFVEPTLPPLTSEPLECHVLFEFPLGPCHTLYFDTHYYDKMILQLIATGFYWPTKISS